VLAGGFDGVHLDLEPVGDADPGYLDLLDALRPVVHSAGGVLSVSAERVEPLAGSRLAMEAVEGHSSWWSAGYLRQVASRVDQVALMTYDTALWTSSAYSGFVRDETVVALQAVPANVALLIGLPAYHGTWTSPRRPPTGRHHKQRMRMQIPLVCVEDGDGDDVADEGVEEGVDDAEADADVVAVVVDCVALGEDSTALDDAAGVVDGAAWRGV
jgi:hypothetical protein